MVQLVVQIRPQRGYTYANSIREVTADSSLRLEQLLSESKIDKKGTSLYSGKTGLELPLNSALASHNIQDGEILETCSSPAMSAVLSAVISDLEALQKNTRPEDRAADITKSFLLDNNDISFSSEESSDWSKARWTFEDVKRRLICSKMMKQLIQRNGRFANLEVAVPQCNDCLTLYDFIKTSSVFRSSTASNNGGLGTTIHNTMEHCFKPKANNRSGKPTLLWELVKLKMDKFRRIAATSRFITVDKNDDLDPIERFVKIENERQLNYKTLTTNESGVYSQNYLKPVNNPQEKLPDRQRKRRHLAGPDSSRKDHQDARDNYCPEYKSGSFSILCTLFEAIQYKVDEFGNNIDRQLSLTENKLKELAQPRCRSNLYDRQARGRTAFACVDKLTSDDFLRKEIIPGNSHQKEGENIMFSLLPKGEKMGKFCLEFERSVNEMLQNDDMMKDRDTAIGKKSFGCNSRNVLSKNKIKIMVDTREDRIFASRLMGRCKNSDIDHSLRDLPAGDYLFTTTRGQNRTNPNYDESEENDIVLPIVIERKTWSDLADSVTGKGRRRLDCVKIGNEKRNCDSKNCQLCRMKKSHCSRVMFIIEGARCLARDDAQSKSKCSPEKRCKYCKELQDRHGQDMIHLKLEEILYRLQADHMCLIHFTRNYNETIDSLFLLREILEAGTDPEVSSCFSMPLDISYQKFCENARMRNSCDDNIYDRPFTQGKVVEWTDEFFIKNVHSGNMCETLSHTFLQTMTSKEKVAAPVVDLTEPLSIKEKSIVCIDCDEEQQNSEDVNIVFSQDSVTILENDGKWASSKDPNQLPRAGTHFAIDVDCEEENLNESQDSVQIIEPIDWALNEVTPIEAKSNKRRRNNNDSNMIDQNIKKTKKSSVHNSALSNSDFTSAKCHEPKAPVLLLLEGLYEYDSEYHVDLNKVWKKLYTENTNEDAFFLNNSKDRLLQLQKAESPFVDREVINFWILFLQLRYDVILHTTRDRMCGLRLHALWNGSKTITTCSPSDHEETVSKAVKTCSQIYSTPSRPEQLGRKTRSVINNSNICNISSVHETSIKNMCAQGANTMKRIPSTSGRSISTPNEIREARLKRFCNPPSSIDETNQLDEGAQTGNLLYQVAEEIKGYNTDFSENCSKKGRDTGWSCSRCTFQVEDNCSRCPICSNPNSSTSRKKNTGVFSGVFFDSSPIPFTNTYTDSESPIPIINMVNSISSKSNSKTRCGACGETGHNRGSATPDNCQAYFYESEVVLRQKKKDEAASKAREALDAKKRLEQEDIRTNEQVKRVEKAMIELQRLQESRSNMTKNEMKRLEKEIKRAQRRYEKL